ncbi:transcriptional regulator [Pseudohongiella acticola]|jgi:predicted DNA-binding transcriptional regulator YafY|uniref:Transcriptional regulator n=1 Tax=Pseudohongiella acticola TaxID=1524254 RepID=A0A1E8CL63_9GAMM|nr:YafY family protein [Pseudohongiella acticola]OFE13143.1 transcriptional regulator [Pseudohongiella acticola]
MSGPTTRVLALLELLQTHGLLSGGELAERLDVDRRTIRRYIRVLEELGIPVTTEQGRYGGYRLVAGFKLPPLMFTDEETLAVSLGLLAAQQLGLAESTPAIASVQAKLERVMPANLKRRVRAVSDTTKLILPKVEPSYDHRTLLTLTTAIQSEQGIDFVYQSPDQNIMPRSIDPYGLVFRRGRWYVSGHCHLRNELRSFRLDRITSVKMLTRRFTRPRDFDAAEHLSRSLSQMPRALPVSVLLHTDADTAARLFGCHPAMTDLFQQQDDGLLLTTHTDSYQWFAWWLSHASFPFTVQGPPELKQALREQAQRLLDAAGS